MMELSGNHTSIEFLSEDEMRTITIISLVTASLSFLGSGSVIVISTVQRRVCYPEVFPIFHLSIADSLASVFLITSSICFLKDVPNFPGSTGPCDYLTSIMMSFYISTFSLTLSYALEAFLRMQKRLNSTATDVRGKIRPVSHPMMYLVYNISWIIPIAIAVILVAVTHHVESSKDSLTNILPHQCSLCLPVYHFDERRCWEHVVDGVMWSNVYKLVFLLPLVLVFLINMCLYIGIARKLQQLARRRGLLSFHQRQEELAVRRKAVLYQSVFFLCWIPSLLLGFLSLSPSFKMANYFWLYILQALLGPLQGFLNSVIYGWKRESFRKALSESTYLVSTNRSSYMSVTL